MGFAQAPSGNPQPVYGERGSMPTWLWVLIIILLVLVLFGGVGYGRRGTRI
jgi:flagellar basal body-associated protein FliL